WEGGRDIVSTSVPDPRSAPAVRAMVRRSAWFFDDFLVAGDDEAQAAAGLVGVDPCLASTHRTRSRFGGRWVPGQLATTALAFMIHRVLHF
ncbi:hypothetical protein, partial [Mycolicibacterium pyrenivorans]|uniref:hypothetical protein n=1 Tax=Mycolicibacterium pyrenivorans TaxID=187102 RepID=UPI0021F2A5A6